MMMTTMMNRTAGVAMMMLLCFTGAMALLASFAVSALAQPLVAQQATRWEAQLEALQPQEPMRYFELAEEIADAATTPAERQLAQHLFALAGLLDRDRLARSACLALADMETDELAKRRLLAMAMLLGDDHLLTAAGTHGLLGGNQSIPDSARLSLANALSHYRKGQGAQALRVLEEPGVMNLLQAHERLVPGGAARFVEDCRVYKGTTRPILSAGDVTRLLRFEVALLAGDDRSWSSDLLLTETRPLIEVDPSQLEITLNVDASRPLYRSGRWVSRESQPRAVP